MSELHYNIFSLQPKRAINAKHEGQTLSPVQGLNLKLKYREDNLYSSLTLHPSLGDLNVHEAIKLLKEDVSEVILDNFKVEYQLKKIDRYFLDYVNHELRTHATIQKNSDAIEDLKIVAAHYKNGFRRFKFKMTQDFFKHQELYANFLKRYPDVEFIFDFNSTAKLSEFQNLKWSKDDMTRTFWEDPIDMKDFDSLGLLKALGFQLILDQKDSSYIHSLQKASQFFDIVAIKPTKESVASNLIMFPESKLLITTNMGNELDHAISAYWANFVFSNHSSRFFGAGLYTRHFFNSKNLSSLTPTTENQTAFYKSQELNPKVRTSFLNLENKDKLRGWGLDREMMRLEWNYLRDLDVEF